MATLRLNLFALMFTSVFVCAFGVKAYIHPLRTEELKFGERFNTFVHAAGIQSEGKDIGAVRHVNDSDWRRLKTDDADSKTLSNWIIYGKSVQAMAPGKIVGCWRNAPENEPGSYHPDYVAGKFAGGGNHLWILQDDGNYVLYAHLQPGSIPSSICHHNAVLFSNPNAPGGSPDIATEVRVTDGAHIAAGQFLGRVGNSGASKGGPHLHIHMEKSGKPMAMTFEHGLTTSFTNNQGSLGGPWTKLAGNAMPKASILFWPPRPTGTYQFNNWRSSEFQGLFDHMADSGEMPNWISCSNNGAYYNSNWIPYSGKWIAYFGLNAAEYDARHKQLTSQGWQRTSSYTCGSANVGVWRR